MCLFWDLAVKTGLPLPVIEDWTPGMVFDFVYYRINDQEAERAPKAPSQDDFDSF